MLSIRLIDRADPQSMDQIITPVRSAALDQMAIEAAAIRFSNLPPFDTLWFSLREVDRLQREFEQSVGDALAVEDGMESVIRHARVAYRKLAEKVQSVFIRHLEKSSWPLTDRLWNADAFDKFVAPKLAESGRRVAVFLIDALRYELGVELSKDLSEEGQAEVQVA